MNSPDQNTGVGSLSLLQGIFPTQGLSLGHAAGDYLPAEPPGKPDSRVAFYYVLVLTLSNNVRVFHLVDLLKNLTALALGFL